MFPAGVNVSGRYRKWPVFSRPLMAGFGRSPRAVLLAEACNTGLEPLVRHETQSLRRDRLSWVSQNYLRDETLRAANARLVAAQTGIPLARAWGGGEVASADGLRFVVPVRTVHAGPNPKYFGIGRGVTYYCAVPEIRIEIRATLSMIDWAVATQTNGVPEAL